MAFSGRQLVVPGPVMVYVKGGAHYSGMPVGFPAELGLTSEAARIELNFYNDDVRAEGYGQQVPADVRHALATARVSLTLLHYDPTVLEVVMQEAMMGFSLRPPGPTTNVFIGGAGGTGVAGKLMGGRKPMYASGNRFVAVSLVPAGRADPERQDTPYRFRKCHLAEMPTRIPLGSECTIVNMTFRCLPYVDPVDDQGVKRTEEYASGAVLWDYLDDPFLDGLRTP